ncbi:MAG: type II toxin-antitoxin system HicB family antitoxin [Phycisphaerae bacterium]|nr:type II toxin-antitoxin system HicB family antitoxin [Phycisphaerae bacterium]
MKLDINIHQTPTGVFRAECATMPGCRAMGRTQEQACQNMRREIACYVASMDGILPRQMDLVVALSVRSGERSRPEPPVLTPCQRDTGRKPRMMHSGRPVAR